MCCGNDTFRITPEGVLQYRYNNVWVSVSNIPAESANNINGEVAQSVILTQVPGGDESFLPERLIVSASDITGFVTEAAISVGIVGPNYTDILASTVITIDETVDYQIIDITTTTAIPAGSTIYLRVITPAVATTYIFNASLEGTYVRL